MCVCDGCKLGCSRATSPLHPLLPWRPSNRFGASFLGSCGKAVAIHCAHYHQPIHPIVLLFHRAFTMHDSQFCTGKQVHANPQPTLTLLIVIFVLLFLVCTLQILLNCWFCEMCTTINFRDVLLDTIINWAGHKSCIRKGIHPVKLFTVFVRQRRSLWLALVFRRGCSKVLPRGIPDRGAPNSPCKCFTKYFCIYPIFSRTNIVHYASAYY